MRVKLGTVWGVAGAAALLATALWLLRPAVVVVDTYLVHRERLQVTIDESGLTRMARHREVVAPVSGQLMEGRLRVGDSVRAGDVVAELRPAALDPRALAEATAAARAADALQAVAEAAVQRAQLARDDSRRELQRVQRLADAGAVAPRDLELAMSTDAANERQLVAARAGARAAAQDAVRARVALRTPSASSQIVRLRAPIPGVVLRLFQEHARVLPAGTTLLEIGDPASVELVVDVLSRDAASIAVGAPVSVALPDGGSLRGRVARVEPAAFTKVSPLGIEEQRVPVIVVFADDAPLVGDRFELSASIVVWERDRLLTVPTTALVPVDSGWGVFVVRGGRAHARAIATGRRSARSVEVTSGLAEADTVVLFPEGRVRDGVRVAATRPTALPRR